MQGRMSETQTEFTTRGPMKLYLACARGQADEVRKLLIEGADINEADAESKITPLGVACAGGHLECVKLMIDAMASVNEAPGGIAPLFLASVSAADDVGEIMTLLMEAIQTSSR